jgi:hypothetical protein
MPYTDMNASLPLRNKQLDWSTEKIRARIDEQVLGPPIDKHDLPGAIGRNNALNR